jgi:CheY-like chemotaxis protein
MKILVIDDDANLGRAIQRMLRGDSISIETDPTRAVAAVVQAELDNEPFDVVLCDLMMPGMTGIEVSEALEAAAQRPVFVLMSGIDCTGDPCPFVDGILVKPFRSVEIRGVVMDLKDKRSRAATQRIRRGRWLTPGRHTSAAS